MVDLSQDLYGFFKGIRIWTFTLVFNVGMEKSENKEYGFILNGNEQKIFSHIVKERLKRYLKMFLTIINSKNKVGV